jgi:hypothetical protein
MAKDNAVAVSPNLPIIISIICSKMSMFHFMGVF